MADFNLEDDDYEDITKDVLPAGEDVNLQPITEEQKWTPGSERDKLIEYLKNKEAEYKDPKSQSGYFDALDRAGGATDRANLLETISKASSMAGSIGGQQAGSALQGLGEKQGKVSGMQIAAADKREGEKQRKSAEISKLYQYLADQQARQQRANTIAAGMQGKLEYQKEKDEKVAEDRKKEKKEDRSFEAAQTDKKLAVEKEKITNKEPTQNQYGAAGYARRLEQAEQTFSELEKDPSKLTGLSAAVQGSSVFPNMLKSDEIQNYEQAKRNFVNSVLRRESGAAISPSEFKSAEKQYFPQPGDSPKVIAQKKANRAQKLVELQGEAGPALAKVPLVKLDTSTPGPDTAKADDGSVRVRQKSTGKFFRKYPDGRMVPE